MDKIKVGEYVRTKDGIIDKIFKFDEILNEYWCENWCEKGLIIDPENKIGTYLKDIVSHSFNIKELIEENDIVEYRINCLSELKVGRVKKYRDARNNKQYLGVEGYDIIKIYIETILTHEQYERNIYKVKEEQ